MRLCGFKTVFSIKITQFCHTTGETLSIEVVGRSRNVEVAVGFADLLFASYLVSLVLSDLARSRRRIDRDRLI